MDGLCSIYPINDLCRDCKKYVNPGDRQELVADETGHIRRLCAKCLAKYGITISNTTGMQGKNHGMILPAA